MILCSTITDMHVNHQYMHKLFSRVFANAHKPEEISDTVIVLNFRNTRIEISYLLLFFIEFNSYITELVNKKIFVFLSLSQLLKQAGAT